MIMAVMGITAKVQAQCTLKDAVITINTASQAGPNCTVNFDLSFEFDNNNGNKTVVIQAWKEDDYPNYWGANCDNNKAPKAADLRKTTAPYSPGTPGPLPFLNIAFDAATQSVINSADYPGGGVTLGSGYTVNVGPLVGGFFKVTLTNLIVTVPNQICGNGVTIRADVWSSQASLNSQWTPHCVICNNRYAFNYPEVSASLNCLNPRLYGVRINNINTSQAIISSWKVYRDDNQNGTLEIGTDPLVDDQSGININLAPGQIYNPGAIFPYIGNNSAPSINRNLIVVVTTAGLANNQIALAANACSPLPVDFKSFTATRNKSNVIVKWETSTEVNSSGFAVERNINGTWDQVAFVPSQAPGGNSSSDLSYQFIDLNTAKGISQYRIKQIDIDNKSKFSDIRSVKGDGQIGKIIVYPNPTADGRVNVVFDDASVTRSITVSDMSGRTVKQINSITNNNITIDNLQPGMYSLRVFVPETGEQSVMKVVVNKR